MWALSLIVASCCLLADKVCSSSAPATPPAFPPPMVVDVSDTLNGRGHLKPYGSQRPPAGPVVEYTEELHPREFYKKHIKPLRPLVYRQMVANSPARRLWSDEYLREVYGSLDVLCEVKEEDREKVPTKLKMTAFLDRYQKEDVYIVTVLPDDMRKEVKAPHSILCGSSRRFIQEANLWMSNGGTRSLLHYDSDHNIHCLLAGRKDFVMIPKKYQSQLYMASQTVNGSGFSRVDPDSVDLLRFPHVAGIPWSWATIMPGDCIFIPGGYIHQVRSYGRSISETVLFTPTRWFNDSDCDTTDLGYTTLADVELKWTYLKGQKNIEMGYMNPELIRENMYKELEASDNGRFEKDAFMEMFFEDLRDEKYDYTESAPGDEVWKAMTPLRTSDKGYLERHDVENAPLEALKTIARHIDPPHDKS